MTPASLHPFVLATEWVLLPLCRHSHVITHIKHISGNSSEVKFKSLINYTMKKFNFLYNELNTDRLYKHGYHNIATITLLCYNRMHVSRETNGQHISTSVSQKYHHITVIKWLKVANISHRSVPWHAQLFFT